MQIREENTGDWTAVRELIRSAFGQVQEADLVEKLRQNCEERLSLVAVFGSRVVGHILFTPVVISGESHSLQGMGLAPVAVAPEYRRQGIGSLLIKNGIARLADTGYPFIIVLGHPEYYPRFGFEPAKLHGIRSEWEVPEEAFMIVVLNPLAMKGVEGVATYRPEFAEAI